MKVIVNKYLNVRVGSPSLDAPCYQYLAPGSEIEVDSQLYIGDKYDGLNTWMKDAANNYYWSGGIEIASIQTKSASENFQEYINGSFDGKTLKSVINYNSLLNINETIKNKKGSGVTIVIMDHPISSNIESNNTIIRPFPSSDPLANFHGNFIFGIIAGIKNIIGISNNVKIISLPIYDEVGNPLANRIDKAFEYISNSKEKMIVNISNVFGTNYDKVINNLPKDKIIVACAGTNGDLSLTTNDSPPGNSNVISVGAVDASFDLKSIKRKVDFLVPNFNFVSFENHDTYYQERGDSYSTAVVSATIAAMISSQNLDYDLNKIKTSLKNDSLNPTGSEAYKSLNILNI